MAKYWGSYDKIKVAHEAIHDYTAKNKIEIGNAPWEVYEGDPSIQKPADLETDVYYEIGL